MKITNKEINDLIVARLQTLSSGRKISIGAAGEFTKSELIASVKKKDKIGKKIIQIQLSYLQSLKQGVTA
jgi:hypothetical protein